MEGTVRVGGGRVDGWTGGRADASVSEWLDWMSEVVDERITLYLLVESRLRYGRAI